MSNWWVALIVALIALNILYVYMQLRRHPIAVPDPYESYEDGYYSYAPALAEPPAEPPAVKGNAKQRRAGRRRNR